MISRTRTVVFRCDATVRRGSGHVMRSLALAQAWLRLGGQPVFVCCELPESLERRVRWEGFSLAMIPAEIGSQSDAEQTLQLANESHADWIVFDGYDFSPEYQVALHRAGQRVLAIDDYGHVASQAVDAILNQNLYADRRIYESCPDRTQLLLGSPYTLLRNEFRSWSKWARVTPAAARNLLVMFGGADAENLTGRVLRDLAALRGDQIAVTAVLGGLNPHADSIRTLSRSLPYPLIVAENVTDMARQMAWADLAVTAAGSTSWELAFMGLPALTIATAENQIAVGRAIEASGLGRYLGWHQDVSSLQIAQQVAELSQDAAARQAMSTRGRHIIDGQGATRVAQFLAAAEVQLRPATLDDARRIWEWRNEPQTRAVSFRQEEIPFESQVTWFTKKLGSTDCQILIAENAEGTPLGQVRIDFQGTRAEISIVLDPAHRGRGWGTTMIRAATRQALNSPRVMAIDAYIKPGNEGSLRAFKKAGYEYVGQELVQGCLAERFVAQSLAEKTQRLAG